MSGFLQTLLDAFLSCLCKAGALLWQPAGFRPGRPGNFLLMAQKKVTKEEGLNTMWLAAVATTVGC